MSHTYDLNTILKSDHLFLISGPCVVESRDIMMRTAEKLKETTTKLGVPFVFKSSFMKDNRSSLKYYHGPGLADGLAILQEIKEQFNVPVLSDVHYPEQVNEAARVLDIIQIPAYLCMQSSLVVEAAKTGKYINLKHGQFLSPQNMMKPVEKVESTGNKNILLTERGYTFGYNDLVVDPRAFFDLGRIGYPVIFDLTHSIRRYGIPSADPAGGLREYLPTLARSGVAAGINGLFIEAHPKPEEALCDAASQMYTQDVEEFLKPLLELHSVIKKYM